MSIDDYGERKNPFGKPVRIEGEGQTWQDALREQMAIIMNLKLPSKERLDAMKAVFGSKRESRVYSFWNDDEGKPRAGLELKVDEFERIIKEFKTTRHDLVEVARELYKIDAQAAQQENQEYKARFELAAVANAKSIESKAFESYGATEDVEQIRALIKEQKGLNSDAKAQIVRDLRTLADLYRTLDQRTTHFGSPLERDFFQFHSEVQGTFADRESSVKGYLREKYLKPIAEGSPEAAALETDLHDILTSFRKFSDYSDIERDLSLAHQQRQLKSP